MRFWSPRLLYFSLHSCKRLIVFIIIHFTFFSFIVVYFSTRVVVRVGGGYKSLETYMDEKAMIPI